MNITLNSMKIDAITTEQSKIFRLVNYVTICALIGLFGICSNIINMIVFRKQGFTTTVNISFFALALSDFLCLLTLEWFNICLNPYMETAAIPFISTELQCIAGGAWFHVCFSRTTSWITAYITAERCLSVALPLKVKQIVSPRKTTISMTAIFAINLMTLSPEYCIVYLDWKFVPERNKTLIGLLYRSFKKEADGLAYTLTSMSGMLSLVAVILLTTFLTIKLTQKSNWRFKASTNDAHSDGRSLRDKKTMKMVVMIAAILIICYAPGSIATMVTVFEPDFVLVGRYANSFFAFWSFGFILSSINSSINTLLYYSMSTKYRETFNQLFVKCRNRSVSK